MARRHRLGLPLALMAGSALLYALAFPPAGLAALAWIALVPLLAAVTRVGPRAAAGLGLVWGLLASFGVTWWFPGMVSAYFAATPALGWLVWLAFSTGFAAVWFAAFAAWTSWAAAGGWASPPLVAAAWGVCELARARVLVGDPWALSAYTQAPWPVVVQIADLTGPYGPGMLLAAVNAGIAATFVPALRGPGPLRSAAVVVAALLATLLYGTWRLAQPTGGGAPIKVAIVQPGYSTAGATRDLAAARRSAAARGTALDRQLALTRQALADRPDLVVWPENAVDLYLEEPGPERDALLESLRAFDVDVLLGGPAYVFGPAGLRYRNSVYAVQAGRVGGRYDKLHLLPYAEARDGDGGLEAGTRPYGLRVAGTLVGAFVCFEAMYPELVRRIARGGVEVLANLSNDAWFAAEAPSRLHLHMAAMRAIEQRRWLVRATTTGISAFIDPHGRVVAATPLNQPAVLAMTVFRSRVLSPYARVGDVFIWSILGLVTMVSVVKLLAPVRGGTNRRRSNMSFVRFVAVALSLLAATGAHAAVDCTAREPNVAHVCAGGPNAGQACVPDLSGVADPLVCSPSRPSENDFCAGSKCELALAKDGKFSGTMTIIVDENVSQPADGLSQNVVAATVILDLGKNRLLTQTYQDLSDPTAAPTDSFGVALLESTLRNQAALRPDGKPAAINDLLYRPQDDELATALRALLGATGTPVITKVSGVALIDQPGGLGTILRVKIKGGFVQP